MRGGADQGELRSRPRVVGVVDIRGDFQAVDAALSPPYDAAFTFEPQPIIDQRMGLPHRAGRYRFGGSPIFPPGVLEFKIDGEISDSRMEPYRPSMALDQSSNPSQSEIGR